MVYMWFSNVSSFLVVTYFLFILWENRAVFSCGSILLIERMTLLECHVLFGTIQRLGRMRAKSVERPFENQYLRSKVLFSSTDLTLLANIPSRSLPSVARVVGVLQLFCGTEKETSGS